MKPPVYPGVTLNGHAVFGISKVRWDLIAGVRPQEAEILVSKQTHDLLMKENASVTLVIDGAEKKEFKGLHVVSNGQSPDPNLVSVRVCDRRVGWEYAHVGPRRYNVRRRVGTKGLTGPNQVAELTKFIDKIAYHPGSLKDGEKKWTAAEVVEDVLQAVIAHEDVFSGGASDVTIPFDIRQLQVPVEELVIDDQGPEAVSRVLAYLPGASVTVDPGGGVRVLSTLNGAEMDLVDQMGPESVGEGHVTQIDNHKRRPGKVIVEFDRQTELLFKFETDVSNADPDARLLANVLQVTDQSLHLGGALGTVPQGTWVDIQVAIDAWNAKGTTPRGVRLTKAMIDKCMCPGLSLWSAIGLAGQKIPDADWSARIGALKQHYRRTFRLPRSWVDRIHSLKAYRIATIDVATGERGPATVYADYSYIASDRSMTIASYGDSDIPYASNVAAYPKDGKIGATTRAAPCKVVVLDEDQGIIQIEMVPDIYGVFETMLPSQVEKDGDETEPGNSPKSSTPGMDPHGTAPISWNVAYSDGKVARLTRQWKMAVILTASPMYPNNENQLHQIEVRPNQVKDLLPGFVQKTLNNADGPPMYVRVTEEQARVAWVDDQADLIASMYGLGPDGKATAKVDGLTLSERAKPITINVGAQADIGDTAASCDAIALAAAAAVYGAYADHAEGSKTVPLRKDVLLDGWASAVSFSVAPNGECTTTLTLAGMRKKISMFALMDPRTRRVVMRTVS